MPKHERYDSEGHIVNEAGFVSTPGQLDGEDLKRAREARRLRAHLQERERYRAWQDGEPEDPELAFWTDDGDA